MFKVWHPDKNPDNLEEATTRFKEIQLAFQVLSAIDIIGNGNREVTMLIADTAASNSIRSEANERRKAEMLKIWRRTIG